MILIQTKEVPDGAKVIIVTRDTDAQELQQELDRAIDELELEVKVFITSKWNSSRLSQCYECRGTGSTGTAWDGDLKDCIKCKGKGVILA